MEQLCPLLEMRNITKQYPGVLANDKMNFVLDSGEIHSLLGENGAGKSTLMSILYGLVTPDNGQIFINGSEVTIHSPNDAISKGIGMVHQHFMLVDRLSVVENIVVGTRPKGYPLYNQSLALEKVSRLIKEYGFEIDPLEKVSELSVGQQQRVEIIKALYRGAKILILDEPTAVLTPNEVADLFRLMKDLKSAGHGIVFISHKLNETLENSDKITIIRRGKVIDTVLPRNVDRQKLANLMVGRQITFNLPHEEYNNEKQDILVVKNLTVINKHKRKVVKNLSFSIPKGTILGIAGVDGNGQRELVETLTGLQKADSGSVSIDDVEILGFMPDQILTLGVAHIPEDRQRRGLVMKFRIDENMILHDYNKPPYVKFGLLQHKKIFNHSKYLSDNYDIRPPNPELKANQLSGGNQQKIILARELGKKPKLIIAMQPTRGLDVGATEYIHKKILEARSDGAAILLVSTELEEVLSLSDRIAVMYEGEIVGTQSRKEINVESIGMLMGGIKDG